MQLYNTTTRNIWCHIIHFLLQYWKSICLKYHIFNIFLGVLFNNQILLIHRIQLYLSELSDLFSDDYFLIYFFLKIKICLQHPTPPKISFSSSFESQHWKYIFTEGEASCEAHDMLSSTRVRWSIQSQRTSASIRVCVCVCASSAVIKPHITLLHPMVGSWLLPPNTSIHFIPAVTVHTHYPPSSHTSQLTPRGHTRLDTAPGPFWGLLIIN